MSASGLDVEKHAAYEHRKFLSHLSDKLSKTELRKIVFHEDLPKGLLDGENKYPDPMDVMINLHMQKKTAPEELSRILSDVNRQDLVKLVAKSAKKNPQKRKTSGPSSPKLEDTLSLTVKSSDLLAEHVELALKHAAASRENKRIEELVSEAKSNLISVVQRKLRYAYGLLNSQTQTEQCACNPSSSSTGSSPESSLTLKPPDPGHQRPQITLNDADLKKVFENLKPPSVELPHPLVECYLEVIVQQDQSRPLQHKILKKAKRITCSSPAKSSRNSSDNEDDIYTVPGPAVKTTASPTQTSDVTYYNYPVRDHQALSGSENGKVLLVTGSSKIAKPGPSTKPKPLKGKSHTNVRYTAGNTTDASSADDYSCSTNSCTGDSGFSDSQAFRQKESPPSSPKHTSAQNSTEHVLDSGASHYASLITSDVHNDDYYKTLHRECAPEAIYDMNGTSSNKN